VLRGGWLFDGVADERRRNTGIVIRDGKFADVRAELTGRELGNARIIELDDEATILPGMIDLHAHYNMDLVDEGRVEEVENNAMLFLANGVTATWSAGEFVPERVIEARDRIARGDAIGTRVFNSGPYFGAFRCEYQIETAADDCAAWPNDITEEEIRQEVDTWYSQGVTSIKIKQATAEETRILIDQAHKNGMTAAGHLANYEDVYDVHARDAIAMKID
ncbi:MAG: amidohydrolase family protein, partial [bacterium]|nr:amidohydrolase family protein [bacterium]